MKIDVHAHLFPERYIAELDRVLADPQTAEEKATKSLLDNKVKKDPAMWTVDERLRLMERLEVDYQVLSLSLPQAYEGDRETRKSLAQMSNDLFAAEVGAHPDHFLAFGSVPLPNVDDALEELARCMDQLHLAGLLIGSNVNGLRLDDPLLAPLFEEIDRRGLTVLLHPMTPSCAEMVVDYNMASTLGFIFDTGVTVYRMIFSGMFEKYRRMQLIVPHLGGMLPYLIGRVEGAYRSHPACKGIPRPPTEYMKELYYDLVSYHVPSIHLAAQVFGTDHLLLGSDYPFGLSDLEMAVQSVQDAGFSAADQELIYSGNAKRLLGLPNT